MRHRASFKGKWVIVEPVTSSNYVTRAMMHEVQVTTHCNIHNTLKPFIRLFSRLIPIQRHEVQDYKSHNIEVLWY